MINILSKEPLLKKTIMYMSLSTVILILFLNIFHIHQLNLMYKEQIKVNNRIIGGLIEKYPNDEFNIIDSLKSNDESLSIKGQDLLIKYGYKENNIFNDDNFKGFTYKSMLSFFIVSIIGVTLNLTFIKKFFKEIISLIKVISDCINNFMENKYKAKDIEEKEGIFVGVISRLNDLGKKLDIEMYKLKLEKDNLKSLVTDISHQLKTPLSSIKLYNSILMQEDISAQDRDLFLARNENSIKKLHNLIDALVNVSRLESGMIDINKENKSIKQTIIKAVNSAYIKAMEKDISINLEHFEDIKINHDLKWTEEAIFNVIDNAIKYSEKGTSIDIKVSSSINYIRIDIKDSGIGISKDEVNNVFKRFYRVNNKIVKNTEGSGVGLYLTRKILETQGGNIICNKNIDKGSTFSLLLQKCDISDISLKDNLDII